MKRNRLNIGIVAPVITKVSINFLSDYVDILYPLSDDIHIIAGQEKIFKSLNDSDTWILDETYGTSRYNKGIDTNGDQRGLYIHGVKHETGTNVFTRILNYIYLELRLSYKLVKLTRNVDLWIFFKGGEALVLPMLIAKSSKKGVVIALVGSIQKQGKIQKDIFLNILSFFGKLNYILSDRIIVYSKNLIVEWNLEKYKDKICIAHEHFLDFDNFKIKKGFDERDNLVGYIGRLSEEKGVLNFVKAIPKILEKKGEVKFLIGGDGKLRNEIEKYLEDGNLNDKVKLTAWIPHDELPEYMNELKLVVLPSYTEGLPNIMLEAMACSTPVLATSVGAIPDVIKDGETGFIMEDNSPECIAENVIRALEYPNLDEIIKNARKLVEKEYTYEAAVESYRKIRFSLTSCG